MKPRRLFCPCGAVPAIAGLCRFCYGAAARSHRRFGGQREAVLRRDQRRCVVCGSAPPRPHVHHRRAGCNRKPLLTTLCASCHVRVHRFGTVPAGVWPAAFVELWAEQHRGTPVQMAFDFGTVPVQAGIARAGESTTIDKDLVHQSYEP